MIDLIVRLNDVTGMKLRGLPFTAKREDVMFFFSDYAIFPESIKLGRNSENNKTGEAACLFKTEDDCKKAFIDKQGQNIGHRWIQLLQITYEEYLNFENK